MRHLDCQSCLDIFLQTIFLDTVNVLNWVNTDTMLILTQLIKHFLQNLSLILIAPVAFKYLNNNFVVDCRDSPFYSVQFIRNINILIVSCYYKLFVFAWTNCCYYILVATAQPVCSYYILVPQSDQFVVTTYWSLRSD